MKKVSVKKLSKFDDFLKQQLQDSEFNKAYHALDEKYALISQILEQRIKKNISQKQLAERMGTKQSALSRLEGGNSNPSLAFLKKLAKALDCKLEIRLVG